MIFKFSCINHLLSFTDNTLTKAMSRRRAREESGEADYGTDSSSEATLRSEKRARSSGVASAQILTASTLYTDNASDTSKKLAIATCRVILGFSNMNKILKKSNITKIIEEENEKGSNVQFKKHIMPVLSNILTDVFNYDIVELPSKKTMQSVSIVKENANGDSSKVVKSNNPPSDEFVLVNNLPPCLRALNYSFLADYTKPMNKSLKGMESNKVGNPNISIYGENLPRPTTNIIQDGIKLLIISIVLLHNNNILQSDLITILKTNFGFNFKEKESVPIFGNQTLGDFLTMLSKQEYLERTLITVSNSGKGATQRNINSKNARHEDNTLMIKLGRKCVAEWSSAQFVHLLRQIMQDKWGPQLQENAIYTVESVWKEYDAMMHS